MIVDQIEDVDIFTKGKELMPYPLLNDAERIEIVTVNEKLAEFENIIKTSIRKKNETFCNGIIINGAPGTGKSHNINKWIQELIDEGSVSRVFNLSGRTTAYSFFSVLADNCTPEVITVLDDCDIWWNVDCLNLAKAALETKSQKGRIVTWASGGETHAVEYNSFMILITNTDLYSHDNDHIRALLSRVHFMNIGLTVEDMRLKNFSIIENFINENEELAEEIKGQIRNFCLTELHEFLDKGCFEDANVGMNIRFILKIADLYTMFGEKWKAYSNDYKRLRADYLSKVKTV